MANESRDELVELESPEDGGSLVLSDLLNHVFDKGVVISGSVTISIADIDLVQVSLGLVISSVETALQRLGSRPADASTTRDAHVPVLPPGDE